MSPALQADFFTTELPGNSRIYVHKSFSITLEKGMKKNIKKKEELEKLENINYMKWEH